MTNKRKRQRVQRHNARYSDGYRSWILKKAFEQAGCFPIPYRDDMYFDPLTCRFFRANIAELKAMAERLKGLE